MDFMAFVITGYFNAGDNLYSQLFSGINGIGNPGSCIMVGKGDGAKTASFARCTRWAGVKLPSDASECVCKSTKPMDIHFLFLYI